MARSPAPRDGGHLSAAAAERVSKPSGDPEGPETRADGRQTASGATSGQEPALPCARPGCGHTAWAHGYQSGHPTAADPCRAAAKDDDGWHDRECPCDGYTPEPGPGCPQGALGVPGTPGKGCEAASGAAGGDSDPAARLRWAADELTRRAAAATPGPWEPEYAYRDRSRVQAVFVGCVGGEDCDDYGCDHVDCIDGTHGIGGFDLDGDNRWVILANPDLAAPLAAWLRVEANALDVPFDGTLYGVTRIVTAATEQALAVADVILGGETK